MTPWIRNHVGVALVAAALATGLLLYAHALLVGEAQQSRCGGGGIDEGPNGTVVWHSRLQLVDVGDIVRVRAPAGDASFVVDFYITESGGAEIAQTGGTPQPIYAWVAAWDASSQDVVVRRPEPPSDKPHAVTTQCNQTAYDGHYALDLVWVAHSPDRALSTGDPAVTQAWMDSSSPLRDAITVSDPTVLRAEPLLYSLEGLGLLATGALFFLWTRATNARLSPWPAVANGAERFLQVSTRLRLHLRSSATFLGLGFVPLMFLGTLLVVGLRGELASANRNLGSDLWVNLLWLGFALTFVGVVTAWGLRLYLVLKELHRIEVLAERPPLDL